ncbi:MAG TPA: glycosyltransferase, partial [Nitrosomonas sp.]|nr:glycosyltransferase [Nitrosomonas sp.]
MSEKNSAVFPLVSVIIRSMDRATLEDALDSVASQTYRHIEVIIVNAKGAGHREAGEWCGHFPLRMIESAVPLDRARAANIGLNAAKGDYLIFLDDDDLFYPEHISNLVTALQSHPNVRCAYAGVHVEYYVDGQLETSTQFNEPFDQRRLWGRNFIPIHAMLFEQSLVTKDHCRFDEHLGVFEDWDFWIQLMQHSAILHIGEITAVYRNHGHSGMGLGYDKDFVRESRSKVFDKWKMLLTGKQLDDLIEFRENLISDLRNQLADRENLVVSLQNRLEQEALVSTHREQSLHKTISELNKTISELHSTISELNKTIHGLFHSTSWRMTAPLRFLIRIIRGQYHE